MIYSQIGKLKKHFTWGDDSNIKHLSHYTVISPFISHTSFVSCVTFANFVVVVGYTTIIIGRMAKVFVYIASKNHACFIRFLTQYVNARRQLFYRKGNDNSLSCFGFDIFEVKNFVFNQTLTLNCSHRFIAFSRRDKNQLQQKVQFLVIT